MEKEFEAKSLIKSSNSENVYLKLQPYFVKCIEQSNIYFDTEDDFYKKNNAALRLRKKNDYYELTLKVKKIDHNQETNIKISKIEYEEILSTKQFNYDLPLKHNIDSKLNLSTIFTIRNVYNYNNIIIEFDKSYFNDYFDFEIEIEANNSEIANQNLNEVLNFLEISKIKSESKISRFHKYNK